MSPNPLLLSAVAFASIVAVHALAQEREPAQPIRVWPVSTVRIDAGDSVGPLELWRHTIGHGGVNSLPLPERVVTGTAALKPRLVRVFLQEFFAIYPEHGRFDWSRLDPYMDALARTGANVVAAITIKPRPLYPKVDASVWLPEDVDEWQRVVAALVKRYSVDRKLVTYWEIGNETDIGENGGCPYLIPDPSDYAEYYRMTIEPILETFPQAKVGGPGVANGSGPLLPGFIERCAADDTRLDFVSWHLYADDPARHAGLVKKYRALLDEKFPKKRPEMLMTEWNKGFEKRSVEEQAFDPRRAAAAAAGMIAMTDAGVDWSFYYHLWDQTCYVEEFRPFFRDVNIMYHHWNESPHRFGLFGVNGEVRPQYFVYPMLARIGSERLNTDCEDTDLHILAGRERSAVAALIANYGQPSSKDRIASLRFSDLKPGVKHLCTWRIDRNRRWSSEKLELLPLETREIDARDSFTCQVACPADSVTLVRLEDRK